MTLPAIVTDATVRSFALMLVVLSAFFLYFCAIFWAFHTPRLTEQEPGDQEPARARGRGRGGPRPSRAPAALGAGEPKRDDRRGWRSEMPRTLPV